MNDKQERSTLGVVMKWVGIGAALLSFGSAIYGLLQAQANMRERGRVVAEQMAAGRLQQAAGDYAEAWASFERAREAADADGGVAKLLGGLSAERREVRAAQEDLAMEWVRSAGVPEGHRFSEIVEKPVEILSAGVTDASGTRKADLLAHIGWAYFLKQRDGNSRPEPTSLYRDAVAADATNPYANAFWGHFILWTGGPLAEANDRFAAALASNRARATVRHFQLSGLRNERSDGADAVWWQVVNDMYKGGEPLDGNTLDDMAAKYYFALDDDDAVTRLLTAVPPADHVELQRMLLRSPGRGGQVPLRAALAVTLEAAGRAEESLGAWRDLQAGTRGEQLSAPIERRMSAALKRLSPAAPKVH